MLQAEQYAVAVANPRTTWALVGDPRRLPHWTDAEEVLDVPDRPLAVKDTFVTVAGGDRLEWMVITAAPFLLEVKTKLPRGRLGLGVRVLADPAGSRLVLAALYDPAGSRLRARLVDMPALRRRLDRWIDQAVRVLAG